jgi:hypothetical protein
VACSCHAKATIYSRDLKCQVCGEKFTGPDNDVGTGATAKVDHELFQHANAPLRRERTIEKSAEPSPPSKAQRLFAPFTTVTDFVVC